MIDSKVRYGTEQRVYYVVRVSVPGEPKVTIGLAAGRRLPDGMLTTDILVNDVEGLTAAPGSTRSATTSVRRPRRCPPSATSSAPPTASSALWTGGRSMPVLPGGVSTSRW